MDESNDRGGWQAADDQTRVPEEKGASTVDTPANPLPAEEPGAQIGRYKLLEKIGEGGFGAVYVAEQKTPIKRRVALKIIKLGMDTRSVVARFEAERQALAMMDHPNIAKVLDAGATETGRPFFVMELVRGVPITEYCDQNNSTPAERIALFIQVCQAIQHAHQKGIIHRDIKPTNILVTLHDGVALPKVIDFGIAKATQGDLTEKTIYTQFHQFIGTPAYMSPEQAEMSGLDVDTRSDIYSLGVVLYELLTGSTPFDARELMKAGMDEVRRTLRQVDPIRPSNRLSGMTELDSTSTAKRRGLETNQLIILLRGDLDWIVMKCLEKDRTRRYETANGLAVDLQRHLNNEPISARPPSSMYRARKFVRRNKLIVGAAICVLVAMVLGMGLAMVGFLRANSERKRAEAALAQAQEQRALADDNFRSARAAVEDLLQISDERLKDQAGLQPLRVELMKAAIDRYEPFLTKPISDPTPRAQLARLYAGYALEKLQMKEVLDQSVMAEFEKAKSLQEQLLQEHPGDRSLRADLGWTFILEIWRPHDFAPLPEETGRRAIKIFRDLVAEVPGDPFLRDDLAWSLWRTSYYLPPQEGVPMAGEAVAICEKLVQEFPLSAEFRRDLANSLRSQARALRGDNPTVESAARALPAYLRTGQIYQAVWEDLKSNRPGIFQPRRPRSDQGSMFIPSLMWQEFDLGLSYRFTADLYMELSDWTRAAEMNTRAATYYKELVEKNPSVATFHQDLARVLRNRIDAAQRERNNKLAAAYSKDAVAFWNRQVDLHPDVPELKNYADETLRSDSELSQKLTHAPSTQAQ